MRRLTLGLLGATYLCVSLTVALTLWRNGGGWGAGVAALVGAFGLCFAFHGLIARALENATIRGEIDAVREAHKILIDQVERLDAKMSEVIEAVELDSHRGDELEDEVHMLESLVERLQHRFDERVPLPAAANSPGPLGHNSQHRQAAALMDTVRDALSDNRVD